MDSVEAKCDAVWEGVKGSVPGAGKREHGEGWRRGAVCHYGKPAWAIATMQPQ